MQILYSVVSMLNVLCLKIPFALNVIFPLKLLRMYLEIVKMLSPFGKDSLKMIHDTNFLAWYICLDRMESI